VWDAARNASGATYQVPRVRLAGTDIELLCLSLRPGGRSRQHSHEGEELMILLSGKSVNAVFPEHGLRGVLAPHAVFHFDATQQHFVENSGDKQARILIIRNRRTALR